MVHFDVYSTFPRRKRQYDSVSEDEEDDSKVGFYDDDLNDSRSSDGCWENDSDFDSDIDDPLADYESSRGGNFEESHTSNQDYKEIDSDFDSDSDDESDFNADDDTDYDGDWSWDEAMEDPLAPESSNIKGTSNIPFQRLRFSPIIN